MKVSEIILPRISNVYGLKIAWIFVVNNVSILIPPFGSIILFFGRRSILSAGKEEELFQWTRPQEA